MDRWKEGYNDCDRDWRDKIENKIKILEGQEDWYLEHGSLQELNSHINVLKDLLKKG